MFSKDNHINETGVHSHRIDPRTASHRSDMMNVDLDCFYIKKKEKKKKNYTNSSFFNKMSAEFLLVSGQSQRGRQQIE